MMTADGMTRVTVINRDGRPLMKIEDRGGTAPGAKPTWYHRATVRTIQEVARHVDLASLREVE